MSHTDFILQLGMLDGNNAIKTFIWVEARVKMGFPISIVSNIRYNFFVRLLCFYFNPNGTNTDKLYVRLSLFRICNMSDKYPDALNSVVSMRRSVLYSYNNFIIQLYDRFEFLA